MIGRLLRSSGPADPARWLALLPGQLPKPVTAPSAGPITRASGALCPLSTQQQPVGVDPGWPGSAQHAQRCQQAAHSEPPKVAAAGTPPPSTLGTALHATLNPAAQPQHWRHQWTHQHVPASRALHPATTAPTTTTTTMTLPYLQQQQPPPAYASRQPPTHSRALHTAAPTSASQEQQSAAAAAAHLSCLEREPAACATGAEVLDSIVKVFTVHSRPNHSMPWQNHPKRESTGTGFVVHDRLIITNAHCVADATYVLLKRHGSGAKFRAQVVAVGHDCDLALLRVADEEFWAAPTAMLPLRLGELPALQDAVVVVGYPQGGDNTSITSGVVSRVEVAQYVHAAAHLMAIQIDAAINPGNSGGPALQGDVVVGVAFQNLPMADSIGYVIPTAVLRHFLAEVARHGRYKGHCSLGLLAQNLDNPGLRQALGMGPAHSGVLINNIQPTAPAAQVLRKGDVLLEFNGVPLANDGTVHLRHRERIYFSALITLCPSGTPVHLKILRAGQVKGVEVTVGPIDSLVPVHLYDQLPSYYVFGGLVLATLSQPHLHEFGDDWALQAPRRLYHKAMFLLQQRPRQRIVFISQVLVDDVNTGYQQFQTLQVCKVDGEEALNLAHLKRLVEGGGGRWVRLELEDDRLIVLDRHLAARQDPAILRRYRVPAPMSPDLLDDDDAEEGAAGGGSQDGCPPAA